MACGLNADSVAAGSSAPVPAVRARGRGANAWAGRRPGIRPQIGRRPTKRCVPAWGFLFPRLWPLQLALNWLQTRDSHVVLKRRFDVLSLLPEMPPDFARRSRCCLCLRGAGSSADATGCFAVADARGGPTAARHAPRPGGALSNDVSNCAYGCCLIGVRHCRLGGADRGLAPVVVRRRPPEPGSISTR